MKRLLERIGKFFDPPPETGETREVAWDATGYEVREFGLILLRVPWENIQEIFAFSLQGRPFNF